MGEVYCARDTRLKRLVAIKRLPESFAGDPERLRRLRREAEMLASLSHPNIAAVFGLEESSDTTAIVMEFVEGPTLGDRISLGRIPLDEALSIAAQIATGLEAAHEQGIVHRDLKPGNIKVRPDGMVKILDFGLAKTPESNTNVSSNRSVASTITVPMTQVGAILGTPAYMSPEQASGSPIDRRTDIWAFACVLYEMLTGTRAFAGQGVTETLAAVLTADVDLSRLPPGLSPTLQAFLSRCLHKDPKRRVRDIGDVRLALEGAFESDLPPTPASAGARSVSFWRAMTFGLVGIVSAAILGGGFVWLATRPKPPALVLTEVTTAGPSSLAVQGNDRDIAITSDGSRIVYRGRSQLLVRALDQREATALTGIGEPRGVFISPDDEWIGFFDGNAIRKVSLAGGAPITVTASDGTAPRGATWGEDGTIVYATAAPGTGLLRVSASGGGTTVVTTPAAEGDHWWPEFLPGGRAVLFTRMPPTGGPENAQIVVLDLQTATQTVLVRGGSHARYVPSGHLVYGAAGELRAVAFDLNRLAIAGTPVTIESGVLTTNNGAIDAMVSDNGTLVYVAGRLASTARTLVWVDREGREEPLRMPLRPYAMPRISPDGTRIAVFSDDQDEDLWVWDVGRARLTRVTFDPRADLESLWMPDGRLVFSSARTGGVQNLFVQAADPSGSPARLTESGFHQNATGITADGTRVVFAELNADRHRDLWLMTLNAPTRAGGQFTKLIATPFEDRGGVVSPNGRWLAYESNSSGRFEIYVRPFPDVEHGQWQVSTGGGVQALWARNGQELFYLGEDGALRRVLVEARESTWRAGMPMKVLEERYFTGGQTLIGRQYDVSRDGRRFLMIKESGANAPPQSLLVVQSWHEKLKRVVPSR
jgi:serine/threonine-protein kinase